MVFFRFLMEYRDFSPCRLRSLTPSIHSGLRQSQSLSLSKFIGRLFSEGNILARNVDSISGGIVVTDDDATDRFQKEK